MQRERERRGSKEGIYVGPQSSGFTFCSYFDFVYLRCLLLSFIPLGIFFLLFLDLCYKFYIAFGGNINLFNSFVTSFLMHP